MASSKCPCPDGDAIVPLRGTRDRLSWLREEDIHQQARTTEAETSTLREMASNAVKAPDLYHVIADAPLARWQAHCELRAPFTTLVALFGAGALEPSEKVRVRWLFEDAADATKRFCVHDSADDHPVERCHSGTPYDWQIHGIDGHSLEAFCRWLSGQVIAYLDAQPRARRLTDRSRERINELVRSGVSAAEAMKQACEWEPMAAMGAACTWPIEGRAIRPMSCG
jgi:hypothetical protein